MRDILELCIKADESARDIYATFADRCGSSPLADTFRAMGREEEDHISWWLGLVAQWDRGLLPDVFPQTRTVAEQMRHIVAEVRALTPSEAAIMSETAMLQTAARLEFFLLDPIFGDLIDMAGVSTSHRHRADYDAHVDRLLTTIESTPSTDGLSSFLAGVLRLASHNARITSRTARGGLAGLPGRTALLTHLAPWAAWSARYGRPFGVMLVDVDNLGQINDAYGHDIGDKALARVAETVHTSLRESDLIAHYGADEFIVLMPEATRADAQRAAQRLVAAARTSASHDVELPTDMSLTVSVGAAVVADPRGALPRQPDEILAAADRSLCEAKAGGRNRAAEPRVLSAVAVGVA